MDKKISQLPAAGALTGTEMIPLVQAGVTCETLLSILASYLSSDPLSSVLATGNKTNELAIVSNNGYSSASIFDDIVSLDFNDGTAQANLSLQAAGTSFTWSDGAGNSGSFGANAGSTGFSFGSATNSGNLLFDTSGLQFSLDYPSGANASLIWLDTAAVFSFNNSGGGGGSLTFTGTSATLLATGGLVLNATTYKLLGTTASRVLTTDSGNNIVSSSTTLTQLSYLDATSSIQTQLNTKLSSATAASTYAPIANPTFTGTVVLGQDGASGLQAVTYQQLISAGLGQNYKEAAKYATTAALPTVVYANGSSGVGATLTGVALAALSIDSSSPAVNDRVLIKNQVSTFQNGWYTVTATGSGAAVFVLTRATDANTAVEFKTGDCSFVASGTTLGSTTWVYTGIDSPTMGTTAITFTQTSGAGSFISGNGITITGTTIAIDTSVTVDKTTAQTLTNKTLTTPIISSISNTGTLTLPTSTDTLVGKATTDILTNKTFDTAGTGNVFKINGTAISDITGTGKAVLQTSPTLVTPVLGVATATSINGNAWTTGTGTLTLGAGKTATISNTLTFTGTDTSTLNIGTGGTLGTAAYTAASAYEVPLTFTSGLTRTANSVANDLITGKAGGQTIIGGTAASENLTLVSTSHATKGFIYVGATSLGAFDITNGLIGFGIAVPVALIHGQGAQPASVSGASGTPASLTGGYKFVGGTGGNTTWAGTGSENITGGVGGGFLWTGGDGGTAVNSTFKSTTGIPGSVTFNGGNSIANSTATSGINSFTKTGGGGTFSIFGGQIGAASGGAILSQGGAAYSYTFNGFFAGGIANGTGQSNLGGNGSNYAVTLTAGGASTGNASITATGGIGGTNSKATGAGGAVSGTTPTSTGGAGGADTTTMGAGGASTATGTTGIGGVSGVYTRTGGAGGAATGATSSINIGGSAGAWTQTTGAGGAASGAAVTNLSGNGANYSIIIGIAGVATGTGATQGTNGQYIINQGGINAFVISGTGVSTFASRIDEIAGADIASATSTAIGAATGNYITVTGTTTITSFDTIQAGARRIVKFSGALILTHNGTSLILPAAANITTVAGDIATFVSLGSGNWVCTQYSRASGVDVTGDYFTQMFIPGALSPADSTTYYWGNGILAPTVTATDQDQNLGYAYTIIGAVVLCSNATTQGSNENAVLQIRNTTQSTSSSCGNFTTNGTTAVVAATTITGLSISVASGDFICMQMDGPAWVTNPVGVRIEVQLLCRRN